MGVSNFRGMALSHENPRLFWSKLTFSRENDGMNQCCRLKSSARMAAVCLAKDDDYPIRWPFIEDVQIAMFDYQSVNQLYMGSISGIRHIYIYHYILYIYIIYIMYMGINGIWWVYWWDTRNGVIQRGDLWGNRRTKWGIQRSACLMEGKHSKWRCTHPKWWYWYIYIYSQRQVRWSLQRTCWIVDNHKGSIHHKGSFCKLGKYLETNWSASVTWVTWPVLVMMVTNPKLSVKYTFFRGKKYVWVSLNIGYPKMHVCLSSVNISILPASNIFRHTWAVFNPICPSIQSFLLKNGISVHGWW